MTSAVSPLSGMRVLVTRPTEQADPLARALRSAGAIPILYPTIRIDPLEPAVGPHPPYDWVIFTSPTAVRRMVGAGTTALAGARIAAVGGETARALAEAGLEPEVVPTDQRQEGLLEALAHLTPGTRVLLPRAKAGRELLASELRRRGCIVDVVAVYQTIPVVNPSAPPPFDAATFASPSALRSFVDSVGAGPLASTIVAVIGPTTRAQAAEMGVRVDVVAESPSAEALVDALVAHGAAKQKGAP